MFTQNKRRSNHWFLLFIVGILPLLMGAIFTFFESQQIVKKEQITTANLLVEQADKIAASAWKMLNLLGQPADGYCVEQENEIRKAGVFHVYFRSIGVVHNLGIICSSAYGIESGPSVEDMILRPLPKPLSSNWSLSLRGTSAAPERPAIIFSRLYPSGYGTYVLIEGQYLVDFMNAIGESHNYQLSIQINDGYPIQTGDITTPASRLFTDTPYSVTSKQFPIRIAIISPASEALRVWQRVTIITFPIAVIFSLLLVALVSVWVKRKMSYRDEIRKGILKGEFSVNYQPVHHVGNPGFYGAEALIRWRHHDGYWVNPDIFIAAAEVEHMVIPLTQHLLNLIARDTQFWDIAPGVNLGINVAAEHLQHPCFVDDIRQFVRKVKDKQFNITLELTERSLIKDGYDVAKKLITLRQEGIKIAIDDFGTGHCSLSYLQQFQLDYLKIDRGFINAIESLDRETPVLDAIISLSERLNLKVVGEGIETLTQFTYLKQHGVECMQGYLYARPMDNPTLVNWLQAIPPFPPRQISPPREQPPAD